MKKSKYGILIGGCILLSCTRQMKFDIANWDRKDDMEYPLRDRMLGDLTTNYKLVGLHYSALIALLDEPQYIDCMSIGYEIFTNYEKYNLITNNCADGCENPVTSATGVNLPNNVKPNTNFKNLKSKQGAIQESLDISSGKKDLKTISSGLDGIQSKQVVVPAQKSDNKNTNIGP